MKKFKAFFIPFCLMFVAVCIASAAEAKVTITVENNRDHNLYLAFRWLGFDSPDDRRAGWYKVAPGATRTITFDIEYTLTAGGFGYFAEGLGKGKYIGGTKSDGMGVIIHTTKSFGGHPEDPIPGGKKVWFKPLEL
jgi:hypothetical protein